MYMWYISKWILRLQNLQDVQKLMKEINTNVSDIQEDVLLSAKLIEAIRSKKSAVEGEN